MEASEPLQFLSAALPPWFAANARPLPWRLDADPYRVWVSEIMLQQTRVEAVIGYYHRFLAALPAIADLAAVPEDQLLKLWEGLGYYSRARNLKKAALQIMDAHGGQFPADYDAIRALPGVGAYTAGAIASICFDLPTPAVDGNVLRVITRYLADGSNIDRARTKKAITDQLRPLYRPGSCGILTQSLMELGACVCIPNGAPHCAACPLQPRCAAFRADSCADYPVRDAKKARKIVTKTVLVLRCGNAYALRKRRSSGLLAGLWEFPNYDAEEPQTADQAAAAAAAIGAVPQNLLGEKRYTHVFTHVEWHMTACYFDCASLPPDCVAATLAELERDYALPAAFRPFAEELS